MGPNTLEKCPDQPFELGLSYNTGAVHAPHQVGLHKFQGDPNFSRCLKDAGVNSLRIGSMRIRFFSASVFATMEKGHALCR
jgi:hypothetical protein